MPGNVDIGTIIKEVVGGVAALISDNNGLAPQSIAHAPVPVCAVVDTVGSVVKLAIDCVVGDTIPHAAPE
jgi:hypothetical protein